MNCLIRWRMIIRCAARQWSDAVVWPASVGNGMVCRSKSFIPCRPTIPAPASQIRSPASCGWTAVPQDSGSLLVTGDIERLQELALVSREAGRLQSTVMIAPHHGSRTSSTAQLIDAVQPRVVVFQSGYRNRFGHPAPDVVERYRSRGIAIVESARCGAWSWQGDEPGREAACERLLHRRYWHDRTPP